MLAKVVIGKREMVVAEEATVGTERGGVGRCEHEMTCAVDKSSFLDCIAAPKDEYKVFTVLGEVSDYLISEKLPTTVLV